MASVLSKNWLLIHEITVRSENNRLEMIIIGVLEQRAAAIPYFTDFTHSCFGSGNRQTQYIMLRLVMYVLKLAEWWN